MQHQVTFDVLSEYCISDMSKACWGDALLPTHPLHRHHDLRNTLISSSGPDLAARCTCCLLHLLPAALLQPPTGDVARKYIKDPELLRFIDLECFIWSTVSADLTPMINAGMVFCDRHFGGINYPVGGVGQIAEEMAAGEYGYGGLSRTFALQ